MKIDTIRMGVVGYGGRGRGMFKLAVSAFDNVLPVAVCDSNPDLLKQAEQDHPGITLFDDFDEMLFRSDINLLLVETPATCHAEFCRKGLEADLNVMSDIPCVASVAEANALWQAAQKGTGQFMTGANPNMWAFVQAAVDLKAKGLLGEPYYMEAEYIHDIRMLFKKTPWREKYVSILYCTHSLGPLLRLIEEDLRYVTCFDTGSHINSVSGQHDAMVALFRTESNVVIRLLTSFINNSPCEGHHYKIYATKGYFERTPAYEGHGSAKTVFYSTELYGERKPTILPVAEKRPEYEGKSNAAGHGGADYALFDLFFRALREDQDPPITLKDGLRMSLPGIYAAESARNQGEIQRIEYPWDS